MLWQKLLGANAAAAIAEDISATLVGTSTSNDLSTIVLPTGLAVGDVALLIDSYVNTSQSVMATPTGWTALITAQTPVGTGSAYHGQTISYRVLTTNLSGNTVTGINTSAGAVAKACFVFRPSSSVTTVAALAQLVKTSVPPTLPTTSAISGARLHFAAFRVNTGLTVTPSISPAASSSVAVSTAAKYEFGSRSSSSDVTSASISSISGSPTYAVMTTFALKLT